MTMPQPERQTANPDSALSAQAIAALNRGRKIEAIKIVRQQTGLGLKDSKELVEAYEQQHVPSATRASVGITANKSRHSLAIGILVVLLVGLMLALMFF